MSVPLDSDGFLRRECPNCEQEFKWHHDDESEGEAVHQYFCPLCGEAAGPQSWWTQAQAEHARGAVMPEAYGMIDDIFTDAFKGSKNLTYRSSGHHPEAPAPEPLHEPDDMVIVEPPCHPEEPVKIPEDAKGPYHCLMCGQPFAA